MAWHSHEHKDGKAAKSVKAIQAGTEDHRCGGERKVWNARWSCRARSRWNLSQAFVGFQINFTSHCDCAIFPCLTSGTQTHQYDLRRCVKRKKKKTKGRKKKKKRKGKNDVREIGSSLRPESISVAWCLFMTNWTERVKFKKYIQWKEKRNLEPPSQMKPQNRTVTHPCAQWQVL